MQEDATLISQGRLSQPRKNIHGSYAIEGICEAGF